MGGPRGVMISDASCRDDMAFRLKGYVKLCATILVIGESLDSYSTIVVFLNHGNRFVEVGNIAIKYFMYSLGSDLSGLLFGLFVTWFLEFLLILLAFYCTRPTSVMGLSISPLLSLLMALYGVGHFYGCMVNLTGLAKPA
jgi:hypothetical protein